MNMINTVVSAVETFRFLRQMWIYEPTATRISFVAGAVCMLMILGWAWRAWERA
jgi:hypothetical protein